LNPELMFRHLAILLLLQHQSILRSLGEERKEKQKSINLISVESENENKKTNSLVFLFGLVYSRRVIESLLASVPQIYSNPLTGRVSK